MILAIGASGFLGPALRAAGPRRDMLFTHHSHPGEATRFFDLCETPVRDLVRAAGVLPSSALVLAGITNIDRCARDSAGTSLVNVVAVKRVIDELRSLSIIPVFTSSDGVFDGTHGMCLEAETVAPILTYGKQKREVERYLESLSPPWLVVRLPKLLSDRRNPRCMLTGWIEALGREGRILCATDQYFTPADVGDVARAILRLVDAGATGVYHLGGPQRLSRRELLEAVAAEYRLYSSQRAEIVECSLRDVPVVEARPLDTSMDSTRFSSRFGVIMRPATEVARLAVRDFFNTESAG